MRSRLNTKSALKCIRLTKSLLLFPTYIQYLHMRKRDDYIAGSYTKKEQPFLTLSGHSVVCNINNLVKSLYLQLIIEPITYVIKFIFKQRSSVSYYIMEPKWAVIRHIKNMFFLNFLEQVAMARLFWLEL